MSRDNGMTSKPWMRKARLALPTLMSVVALLGLLLLGPLLAEPHAETSDTGSDGRSRLLLDERRADVWLGWPAVAVLVETGGPIGLDEVRQRAAQFSVPTTPYANLGQQRQAVWLRLPLQAVAGNGQWVFDIDYPALGQIDLYLLRGGQLVQQQRLGSLMRFDERPMSSRTPAVLLALTPGQPHELYLRVQTQSAMLLPIAFSKPDAYQARENRRQLVQGLLMGLALALLLYSLAHWLSLGEPLFGLYALMLLGTSLFLVHLYGIGQQHLWPGWPAMQRQASPMAVLLALAGAGPFVARSLDTRRHAPRLHRGLLGLAALAAAAFVLSLLGLLDFAVMRLLASVLGLPVALLAVIASWKRARSGDRVAAYMLMGWSTYMLGGACLVCLVYGLLPARLWALHLFQAGWLLEIVAWLRVLGLHIEAVRRRAERSEAERRALESLAHTDALTGLPNRRGLTLAMESALRQCAHDRLLAVYLLDLDGFKPVNDRLGHDVGDELLVQVGRRLKDNLRAADVVARLGGDEFVILATGLTGEADAQVLGSKLLRAFDTPFEVLGNHCRVGLTAGYALAPLDALDGGSLLKVADTAMYAGKQAGRHTLRRGVVPVGVAS